jgi:hypothetical protein
MDIVRFHYSGLDVYVGDWIRDSIEHSTQDVLDARYQKLELMCPGTYKSVFVRIKLWSLSLMHKLLDTLHLQGGPFVMGTSYVRDFMQRRTFVNDLGLICPGVVPEGMCLATR